MKRRKFIKELVEHGCYLKRHGGRHDLYANPANGKVSPVPRHPEIKDLTRRLIRQQLGLEGK